MKPKYYAFPVITMWALTFASSMSILLGIWEGQRFWTSLAISGAIAYFFGTPVGFVLTDLIFGYEVARFRRESLPDLNELAQKMASETPWRVQAVSEDGLQGDIFLGLSPEKWQEVAISILNNRNFTVATVGQVERPKLIGQFKAAGYIVERGYGRYEPTEKLFRFCRGLATTPLSSPAFDRILEYYL